MKREYFLHDPRSDRPPGKLELPLRIGGRKFQGLVIPGVADDQLLATIALADSHAYIQPADSEQPVYHNDQRLHESAWLKSGDRVQLGNQQLLWEVQGDRVLLQLQPWKAEQAALRPPRGRTPEAASDPLPVPRVEAATRGGGVPRWLLASLGLLLLLAIYLLLSSVVVIRTQPDTASVRLQGFPPAIPLARSRLVFPGTYRLRIEAPGYRELDREVTIAMGENPSLSYRLEELPGRLQVHTQPEVEVELFAGESPVEMNPAGEYLLQRGKHSLRLTSERYLTEEIGVEMRGFGESQQLEVALRPAWGVLQISTEPAAAEVRVDGVLIGQTPLAAELLQGSREIVIHKPGFKPVTLFRTMQAGVDSQLDTIRLQPLDGRLRISSRPAGASIRIGEKFYGTTPQTLELAAEVEHSIQLSLAGYRSVSRKLRLAADEEQQLELDLPVEYGSLLIRVSPPDSQLYIDGKLADKNSGRFRLPARAHTLEARKAGYISKKVSLTPRPSASQSVHIELVSEKRRAAEKRAAATPPVKKTPLGQELVLLRPAGQLKMGASRRDAGRRANESRRLIAFKRPFYIGRREVTNAEYRRFRASHDSGMSEGVNLDGDDQPVVNISWDDAARYSNWLSQQEGLAPFYREENGKMVAIQPAGTGYRLPTEAEWTWVARRAASDSELRYPWAGAFPPALKVGNFADARIDDTLVDVVPGYDDGYRGSAPVGSFPPWPASPGGGFYDIAGNVAEWVHDYYAVYPGQAERLVTDPLGPESGTHHVVRGSSWRHGSISELRLSFRDYSARPRADLGFRLARYAE